MITAPYTETDAAAIIEAITVYGGAIGSMVDAKTKEESAAFSKIATAAAERVAGLCLAPLERWSKQQRDVVAENLRNDGALHLDCPECGESMTKTPAHAGFAGTDIDPREPAWRGGYECHGCGAGFEKPVPDEDSGSDNINGAAVPGTKSPGGSDRSECTHPRAGASAPPAIATTPFPRPDPAKLLPMPIPSSTPEVFFGVKAE